MSEMDETVVMQATEVVPAVAELPTFAASDDPRAMAGIRRAKGLGGLAGFALTGVAAHMHGELIASVLLRALAGGFAGYMVAWIGAVTVWRRIIRAELRQTVETLARRVPSQAEAQS